jgi:Arc/MetJ family transcription regulator
MHPQALLGIDAARKIGIELDGASLGEVQRRGGLSSKTAAIGAALAGHVKMLVCKQMAALRSRTGWQGDLSERRAYRPGVW